MKTFKDSSGYEWKVVVNVNTIKRVRDLLDLDLLGIIGGDLAKRLQGDPVLLCNVIYVVCKPQADAEKISDVDFGERMAGDAIGDATKSLLEELVAFSPRPRERELLGRILEKAEAATETAIKLAETRLEAIDPTSLVEQFLKDAGSSSGDAPASSESTPANSPSSS